MMNKTSFWENVERVYYEWQMGMASNSIKPSQAAPNSHMY